MPDEDLPSVFKKWLADHAGAVLKVACAYTCSTDDCQDLFQEILLRVWRSLPNFQGRASAHTWAYRVALNTALDWRKKERRRQSRQRPICEDLPDPKSDLAHQAAHHETLYRLYRAIRQLSKMDAALVLLYLDGLRYGQIADVMGISESNVGVKLHRAKQALGELMKEGPHES